ncbi:hypothetical protein [Rahnella aceris]|uniref:hypothetical protein n=1 Tax=Rahnella sp. (strain Y9602) TaxID=2703885 RepID=UPI001C2578D0|nr:hypothetical protein [Rahnella aceris]MBU9866805.1 hypothetical protein [Rahnella aceris]
METIVALMAGQSAAIVHLALKVAEQTGIDKGELADSFRKSAGLLDKSIRNVESISAALCQIAMGIELSQTESQQVIADEIKKMMH